MAITLADIKKLRDMTQAGMMDCKGALEEAAGDFQRAIEIIREKGKLVASKRADRSATEGVVVAKDVGTKAYMVCLACETDFCTGATFGQTAEQILSIAVANDVPTLKHSKLQDQRRTPVADLVTEKTAKTAKNAKCPFYGRIEAAYCTSTFIQQETRFSDRFQQGVPEEIAHEVAMQATARLPSDLGCRLPCRKLSKRSARLPGAARLDGKPEAMLIASGSRFRSS